MEIKCQNGLAKQSIYLSYPCLQAKQSIISLLHDFEMRQDYLNTSYWCQNYLLSERSERGRYAIDTSNITNMC